ncbi:hypothetical protein DTO207G8_6695 [Paecilomyces variotii]|nr:hypothetical protein DTO207G8_6695 [Paecilomyces variotii]KAJ9373914.1 hypothetical protein DTO282E5_1270 [Paecilomyces variotii]
MRVLDESIESSVFLTTRAKVTRTYILLVPEPRSNLLIFRGSLLSGFRSSGGAGSRGWRIRAGLTKACLRAARTLPRTHMLPCVSVTDRVLLVVVVGEHIS